MAERIRREAAVSPRQHGERLDRVAAELFPEYSRSRLQTWIRGGELTLDDRPARPRDRVTAGAVLHLRAWLEERVSWSGEDIGLELVFEDADIVVLNKPAGLVVHPAAGHDGGTLVNALLHHCPELADLPRAGIVHRLDRDTSGLMAVAKSPRAHRGLVAQLQARTARRDYVAVCVGALTGGATVDAPIGRHPKLRKKMAVVDAGGKRAVTHYRIRERFAHHTAMDVQLETGRTHQIRVHMAHLRHPLVGDPLYGGRPRIPPAAPRQLVEALRSFPRQALHARALGLIHPAGGEQCLWETPLPDDIEALLECLRAHDPP